MDVRSAAKRRAPHRSESEPAKRSNARLHGRNSTWHEGSGELVAAKETRLGAERSFERVAGMVAAAAARTDNGSALDWEYRLAVQRRRRRSQRLQGRLHRGALSGRDGAVARTDAVYIDLWAVLLAGQRAASLASAMVWYGMFGAMGS